LFTGKEFFPHLTGLHRIQRCDANEHPAKSCRGNVKYGSGQGSPLTRRRHPLVQLYNLKGLGKLKT
jgi:hypothetical protein